MKLVGKQLDYLIIPDMVHQLAGLLFFCPIRVAIADVSGIITTNLGKTATRTKVTGRKKDGYITPKYALLPNRRRAFFWAVIFPMSFD